MGDESSNGDNSICNLSTGRRKLVQVINSRRMVDLNE